MNYTRVIDPVAEDKLRTLAEIEAAENAVVILNAYIYRAYKFYPTQNKKDDRVLFHLRVPNSDT